MSPSTLRIVFIVVLFTHGIGHYMGILSSFGIKLSQNSSFQSWILGNYLSESALRIAGGVIWAAAFAGFIGAGLGLAGWLVPERLWQPLAIVSAFVSLAGLLLFWNAFAFLFNKIGAIGINLAVLVSLLYLRWPPEIVNR